MKMSQQEIEKEEPMKWEDNLEKWHLESQVKKIFSGGGSNQQNEMVVLVKEDKVWGWI